MRVVVQLVSSSAVTVDGCEVARIGLGLNLLVGFREGDDISLVRSMAEKVANLRIFLNAEGKCDYSVKDVGGEVLVVPQFTLYGDARKGRRPDFVTAMRPELAEPLFGLFVGELKGCGISVVRQGVFRAMMKVDISNDGPMTILLEM